MHFFFIFESLPPNSNPPFLSFVRVSRSSFQLSSSGTTVPHTVYSSLDQGLQLQHSLWSCLGISLFSRPNQSPPRVPLCVCPLSYSVPLSLSPPQLTLSIPLERRSCRDHLLEPKDEGRPLKMPNAQLLCFELSLSILDFLHVYCDLNVCISSWLYPLPSNQNRLWNQNLLHFRNWYRNLLTGSKSELEASNPYCFWLQFEYGSKPELTCLNP